MNMVITKLQGGLGNQLFQYATGRALALRHNVPLQLDITGYNRIGSTEVQRQYSLKYFNIVADLATSKKIYRLRVDDRPGLLPALQRRLHPTKSTYMIEQTPNYNPTVLALQPPVYLDGYWQTEKYFQDSVMLLRQEITLKDEYNSLDTRLVQAVRNSNAVSVHVRRGDYVSNQTTNQYHGATTIDYYTAALTYITKQIQQPHFYIFSDDISWVQKNISITQPVTYVSNGQLHDYEELILMSQCQHHIIANSSFSWWGAWLNPSSTKLVIAPQQWFNDASINTSDLIPAAWIKL